MGKRLSAKQALSYKWTDHFTKADGNWFLPFLQAHIIDGSINIKKLKAALLKNPPKDKFI